MFVDWTTEKVIFSEDLECMLWMWCGVVLGGSMVRLERGVLYGAHYGLAE